jgi:uncharacterized protein (UPF0333 family)
MFKKILVGAIVIATTISPVVAAEPTKEESKQVATALVKELNETVKAVKEEATKQNLTQDETDQAVKQALVETTKAFARRAKLRNERLVSAIVGCLIGAVVIGGVMYFVAVKPAKNEAKTSKAELAKANDIIELVKDASTSTNGDYKDNDARLFEIHKVVNGLADYVAELPKNVAA